MINNGFILTAAEMLAAEEDLIAQGSSVENLMELAGKGAAQQIWRISKNLETLVLCGPGNNGGDGYVIAQWLRERGVPVTVAAVGKPITKAALDACSRWQGETVSLAKAKSTPQIVDCLFGTGLKRPITGDLLDRYQYLCSQSKRNIAIDVPSGIDSDTGQSFNQTPLFDFTIALGAFKPAHFLKPAQSISGRILSQEIGIDAKSNTQMVTRPNLSAPSSADHKYTRGLVVIVAGEMTGAAQLSALAAQKSGAGYVKILAPSGFVKVQPSIVIQEYDSVAELDELLQDDRIGSVAIGPGLGRSGYARKLLHVALQAGHRLVLDADALTVLGDEFVSITKNALQPIVATPHAGEFEAIFNDSVTGKLYDTRKLAYDARVTILNKGSDTVIADQDNKVALSSASNSWLSSAGTGDVLTGIIAARLASKTRPFEAAQQGFWLHNRAAQLSGAAFSPEQLIFNIQDAVSECL